MRFLVAYTCTRGWFVCLNGPVRRGTSPK